MSKSIMDLAEMLRPYNPERISVKQQDIVILSAKLLLDQQYDFDSDVIYIGPVSRIPKTVSTISLINLICFSDRPVPDALKDNANVNIIVLNPSADLAEILNIINDAIMAEDRYLNNYMVKLFESLAKGKGLQNIVDIGYEMLGNPLHVIDVSWKHLASSRNSIPEDIVWNEFEIDGYQSFASVTHYLGNHFTYKLLNDTTPFFWYDGYTKYGRLMSRIAIGEKPIAVIGVLDQKRPFKPGDAKLVSILCNALSAEMQKNKFIHFTKGLLFEEFIKDLLDKKLGDSKVIEERLKYLRLNLKKYIYVLTADITEFDSTRNSLAFIQGVLERVVVNSKSIVYNDNIVMVVSCDQPKNFAVEYQEKLNEFLHSERIRIGISRPFRHLASIYDCYIQSFEALNLSRHLNNDRIFIEYDEYAIYHMIETCAKQEDLKKFCIPSLLKLIEYDLAHNTSFTKSLYAYLLCSESITESALRLQIHRNTMIYRIEKTVEIMGANLSDYETLLHIRLSFKLLEYDNEYLSLFTD